MGELLAPKVDHWISDRASEAQITQDHKTIGQRIHELVRDLVFMNVYEAMTSPALAQSLQSAQANSYTGSLDSARSQVQARQQQAQTGVNQIVTASDAVLGVADVAGKFGLGASIIVIIASVIAAVASGGTLAPIAALVATLATAVGAICGVIEGSLKLGDSLVGGTVLYGALPAAIDQTAGLAFGTSGPAKKARIGAGNGIWRGRLGIASAKAQNDATAAIELYRSDLGALVSALQTGTASQTINLAGQFLDHEAVLRSQMSSALTLSDGALQFATSAVGYYTAVRDLNLSTIQQARHMAGFALQLGGALATIQATKTQKSSPSLSWDCSAC